MRRSSPETPRPRSPGRAGGRVPDLRLVPGGSADAKGLEMPDEDSLESELARDVDGAFERLVAAYQDRLFGFALRLCANREDAEEVAQDAFVRAYRALKTYPADRIRSLALRAWLYRIALNVARNRFRRKRHTTVSLETAGGRVDDAALALDPSDDPDSRPDRLLEKSRQRADIGTLVEALPPRFRTALILRYIEDLPIAEVAAVLGQPLGTAKSNVHRAINALRVSLSSSRSTRLRALEATR